MDWNMGVRTMTNISEGNEEKKANPTSKIKFQSIENSNIFTGVLSHCCALDQHRIVHCSNSWMKSFLNSFLTCTTIYNIGELLNLSNVYMIINVELLSGY